MPARIPSQDTATGPHRGPSRSPRAPFGPIWGRLEGKLANERTPHPAGGQRAQRGAAGPLRWLLGVPGPIRGGAEPQWGVSIFGPVFGACCCLLLLLADAAAAAARRIGSSRGPKIHTNRQFQLGDPNPNALNAWRYQHVWDALPIHRIADSCSRSPRQP